MKNSAIQWTDNTFNPWEGCKKVAPECKNCYAETLVDHRFGRAKWGKGQPRRRTSENLWKHPLRWNQLAAEGICQDCNSVYAGATWQAYPQVCPRCEGPVVGRRPRVFCLSLGDWLDEEVQIEWLADLLALIHATPNLDWLLLTKRPENFQERVICRVMHIWANNGAPDSQDALWNWLVAWEDGEPPHNVWIGVSAGADQKAALEIPAKVHFLSCEPMLHPLDTTHARGFDWIIYGGESGKNARPLKVDWIREGVRFCSTLGIACFVKQLGHNVTDRNDSGFEGDLGEWPMDTGFRELDSGYQGAPVRILLKDSHGGDMSEWPEYLRVREFPKVREAAVA